MMFDLYSLRFIELLYGLVSFGNVSRALEKNIHSAIVMVFYMQHLASFLCCTWTLDPY
jgi:hypothetical protein